MALRSRLRDSEIMTEPKSGAHTADRWTRIMAPTLGRPFSRRCVDIACRLAKSSGSNLYLVYVLEVPRVLGLDSAMPEEESLASEALEAAVKIAAPFKLTPVARTHRVRNAKDGILAFINEQEIDLLVLGARPDEAHGMPRELTRELFMASPCEVVVDYIAGEGQAPAEDDLSDEE